jgi:hypothetical protein
MPDCGRAIAAEDRCFMNVPVRTPPKGGLERMVLLGFRDQAWTFGQTCDPIGENG